MGIHENLIQSFTNFKNIFIGNIGNSTVAALLNNNATAINQLNSDLLKIGTASMTLQANPYVSPYTHFKSLYIGKQIKSLTVDTGTDTSPVLATTITHDSICLYGMAALTCTVTYTYL